MYLSAAPKGQTLNTIKDIHMKIQSILPPLKPLDLEKCKDIGELLDSMAKTSFGGREIGRAWLVLKKIVDDPSCGVVFTLSGAMTVAKLGRVFGSLISRSIVRAIITTGAIVTHSLVEEVGMKHHEAPSSLSDEELYALKLNRIYDSIEPESNLKALEKAARKAFSSLDHGEVYGSFEIVRHFAAELLKRRMKNGFLGSALNHNVNVYVPALTDSELGLYLFRFLKYDPARKGKGIVYDPFKDLLEYANWIGSYKHIAFLTIGGGVPRNWGQQMLPFLRSQRELAEGSSITHFPKVIAGIRFCPDSMELGHLSGSTYSEGVTWGKFDSSNSESFVEVHCDATIVFPILAKALIEYTDRKKPQKGIMGKLYKSKSALVPHRILRQQVCP